MTAESLSTIFREHFPVDREVLAIVADEAVQQHPQLASFIERVIVSDESKPGRTAAMRTLGKKLYEMEFEPNANRRKDELRVTRTPHEVRKMTTRWFSTDERTDFIRDWALVNAAQELGVEADTLIGPDQVIYCARFHERHLVPFITGKSCFEYGWSDEFYKDEYWRGLATLSVINEWFDEKESYAFIQWAGQQENIKALAEEGHKRRTIDIAVLSEAVGLGSLGPAISRGVL